MNYLLNQDIDTIFLNTKKVVKKLEGSTILITGGNGFLGKYFLEIFKRYNEVFKKKLEVVVYDNTFKKNIYNKKDNISYIKNDVSKKINTKKKFDIIIHAAGIASPFYYSKKPLETLDVAIDGTRICLDMAKKK